MYVIITNCWNIQDQTCWEDASVHDFILILIFIEWRFRWTNYSYILSFLYFLKIKHNLALPWRRLESWILQMLPRLFSHLMRVYWNPGRYGIQKNTEWNNCLEQSVHTDGPWPWPVQSWLITKSIIPFSFALP